MPTPIDEHKRPDLTPLCKASVTIGKALKKGDIVIYESTVYPGATEEGCVPVLERVSGLKYSVDFFVGYSPERINPGDKEHRVTNIKKVTIGSTHEVTDVVDALYYEIITVGTFRATSIKVAEAAKVNESTQHDLNVALMNELAIILNKMGIDTEAVTTAWVPMRCQLIKCMMNRRIHVDGPRVLVMGLTFKENCSDLRNTKVVDMIMEMTGCNIAVDVYDPWVSVEEAQHEYGITPVAEPATNAYDGIILAVGHQQFRDIGAANIRRSGEKDHVLYDLKYSERGRLRFASVI